MNFSNIHFSKNLVILARSRLIRLNILTAIAWVSFTLYLQRLCYCNSCYENYVHRGQFQLCF